MPGLAPDAYRDGIVIDTFELVPTDAAKIPILLRADFMTELRSWSLGSALADFGTDAATASGADLCSRRRRQ